MIVPGADVDDDALQERAAALLDRLRPYSVPIKRYARILVRNRHSKPDWRADARPLTDQYAPANLLQAQ